MDRDVKNEIWELMFQVTNVVDIFQYSSYQMMMKENFDLAINDIEAK